MKRSFYILMLAAVIVSCKKSNDEVRPDGSSTYVKDLPGDTLASIGDQAGKERRQFYPLLFSLQTGAHRLIRNAADSTAYLKTRDWDIAFTLQYNSFITVNNGGIPATPGYGGPGGVQMLQLEQPYDQVTTAPTDAEFTSGNIGAAGWDSGNGLGWYFYSLTNHIAVPVKGRTYVLKTADGHYAKLEMQNIYKGNPAVVTDLFWPAPYLSFRYFVQADGSHNLKTTP